MNIYSLIYTSLPPEDSPWGKGGFQTVYYPVDLLSQKHLLEIEKKIYYPGGEITEFKVSGFFLEAHGKYYYVFLVLKDLPEERDEYGRKGIFLVQGFLFPPELWRKISTLGLFELIKKYLVKSRNEALNLEFLDKKTGNTLPLEIKEEEVIHSENFSGNLHSEFEWQLALALNKVANTSKNVVLAIKGEVEKFLEIIDRLMMFTPDKLKVNLSWDSAFDNGNANYAQIKVAGFTKNLPSGGLIIKVDPVFLKIEKHPEIDITKAESPYEEWFYRCRSEVVPQNLEKALNLSKILIKGSGGGKKFELLKSECFAQVNKKYINDSFLKMCVKSLNEKVCLLFKNSLGVDELLGLIIENFPLPIVATHLEGLIIEKNLGKDDVGGSLPEALVNSGSLRLKLLNSVLSGRHILVDEFLRLGIEERVELLKYIINKSRGDERWILDLLILEKATLNVLLDDKSINQKIKKFLNMVVIDKKYKSVKDIILKSAIKGKKIFELINGELDPLSLLEEILSQGDLSEEELRILIKWSKKIDLPEGNFPYINAFLFPERGISKEVISNPKTKKFLLKCLIDYHSLDIKDLEKLGFDKEILKSMEIEIKMNRSNFLEKIIKKFLNRR